MTTMAKKSMYQAVCAVCYTCIIQEGTKKDCERAATSHINAYQHDVSVLEKKIQATSTVLRTGVSPMNPRVKWAELSCGHDLWLTRRPRVGATVTCENCRQAPQSETTE